MRNQKCNWTFIFRPPIRCMYEPIRWRTLGTPNRLGYRHTIVRQYTTVHLKELPKKAISPISTLVASRLSDQSSQIQVTKSMIERHPLGWSCCLIWIRRRNYHATLISLRYCLMIIYLSCHCFTNSRQQGGGEGVAITWNWLKTVGCVLWIAWSK